MAVKSESFPLVKHGVSEVFVSREYLEQLGIMDLVIKAAESDNFDKVYKILIEDALETKDTNLVKIVTAEHSIRINRDGVTFAAI